MSIVKSNWPTLPEDFDFREGMYNVDFQSLKYGLDCVIEAEFTNLDSFGGETARALYFLGISLSYIRSNEVLPLRKRLVDHLNKWDKTNQMSQRSLAISRLDLPNDAEKQKVKDGLKPLILAAIELSDKWFPVVEKMKVVKATVTKGRKPSENPRKTPERTLENTGTCGICSQNVKRETSGELYMHGFTIASHCRNGKCFGVGYLPHEVSSDAVTEFLKVLRAQKAAIESMINQLKGMDPKKVLGKVVIMGRPVNRDETVEMRLHDREGDLRHVDFYIKEFAEKVKNWKVAKLPG
jgi:hypothetical protein